MMIELCPMHGDFTNDNVMKNKDDEVVLIDLDRFICKGIRGLDKLHYEVDKNSKTQVISFFDYLQKNANANNKLLYQIYLIYRASQEHKNNIKLNDAYYQQLQKTLEVIKCIYL